MSRLIILMYHSIDHPRSHNEAHFCCLPQQFEVQMRHLSESGVPLLSLDQIADCRDNGSPWPQSGVAVTFDDGFTDFYDNALPVLQRYRIPATLFVITQRVGLGNDWMSKRGLPERSLMTWSRLEEVRRAGICLGSHTRTHVWLPECGDKQISDEIRGSKADLEDACGSPVNHFAYPFGKYDERARQAVIDSGYRTACSTRSGFNREDIDPMLLRRIEVYGSDSIGQFRRKLRFGTNNRPWYFPATYYLKRARQKLTGST